MGMAAVDVQALPCDRASEVGGEEQHRIRDVVGFGQPTQIVSAAISAYTSAGSTPR